MTCVTVHSLISVSLVRRFATLGLSRSEICRSFLGVDFAFFFLAALLWLSPAFASVINEWSPLGPASAVCMKQARGICVFCVTLHSNAMHYDTNPTICQGGLS